MGARGSGAVALVFLIAVSLVGGACNRGAARESLGVAEEALAGAQVDLEQLAPGELERLRRTLDAARVELEEGRHTNALRAAQAFPALVRAARARVERRRGELFSVWDEVSGRVPSRVDRLERRVALLAESSPGVAEARRALGEIEVAWAEARRTRRRGDVVRALALAEDVEARLRTLTAEVSRLPDPRLPAVADPGAGP